MTIPFSAVLAECHAWLGGAGWRDGLFEPLAVVDPRESRFLAWEAMARGNLVFRVAKIYA